MILPNVRASFGPREIGFLLGLLSEGDDQRRAGIEERLGAEGLDAVLDDPRTLNAVMSGGGVSGAPQGLVCYLLVRHALLESGYLDRTVADYVAALTVEFGDDGRRRDDVAASGYLVDVVAALAQASGERALRLQVFLGDWSLWFSGLFPDRVTARVHRRGAPGLDYYEELGATGYRLASDHRDAGALGLDSLYRDCADGFPALRVALNRVSDRYLFPRRGGSVDRVLRQVRDS